MTPEDTLTQYNPFQILYTLALTV